MRPIDFCRTALCVLSLCLCLAPVAWAQSEGNLPPVAAPTSRIGVDAIPLVRSQAEQAGDFVSGLLRGLRAGERVQGIAVAVVQGEHPSLQRISGALDAGTPFPAGGIERAVYAVAVMQLIEMGRLNPEQDTGTLLDGRASGVSLMALMAGQSSDMAAIVRVIAKASGEPAGVFVAERIFRPLGMMTSQVENGVFTTTVADMQRFVATLVDGAARNTEILQSESVKRLESTLPRIPGWSFGLPEMRRNGWRALQLDGSAAGFSSRLVVAPDAKLAYLLVVRGRPDMRIWRALDDALFDELLPPRTGGVMPAGPVPGQGAAGLIAGTYEPDRTLRALVFLKVPERDLRVGTRSDGSLILSGAENATLIPKSDGSWSVREGNLSASYRDGELFLSSGAAYRSVAFYERPVLYALLALIAAIITIGAMLFGSMPRPRDWFANRLRNRSGLDRSPPQQERSV